MDHPNDVKRPPKEAVPAGSVIVFRAGRGSKSTREVVLPEKSS